jgi:hypothetical protein
VAGGWVGEEVLAKFRSGSGPAGWGCGAHTPSSWDLFA